MKTLITEYKKINLYGDGYLTDGYFFPLIGKVIKVKILGLFWVDYYSVYY